jgi:hypothetical protein
MDKVQSVSRWLGIVALGVAGAALWRTESRATTQHAVAPVSVSHASAPATTPSPAPNAPITQLAPSPATNPAPIAPVAAAATLPSIAREHGSLAVRRFVIARGVEDRTPVDPGTTFHLNPTDRLYAFVDAANATGEIAPVVIEFERGNSLVSEVELTVPARPRWRTWGFTRMIHTPGHFTAVLRTREGHELARTDFDVT